MPWAGAHRKGDTSIAQSTSALTHSAGVRPLNAAGANPAYPAKALEGEVLTAAVAQALAGLPGVEVRVEQRAQWQLGGDMGVTHRQRGAASAESGTLWRQLNTPVA